MADRKVLNKYYPPDFDPVKLQAHKKILKHNERIIKGKSSGRNKVMNVRMMFPFTFSCDTCKEFVYVGTKFNSRVQKVEGEDYLGIIIWRFWGRCPNCRSDILFKTDPKNGDYILESGGVRTYDSNKDEARASEIQKKIEEEEMQGDKIKVIEARTYNSQRELQNLENLEELRKMNKRLVDTGAASDMAMKFLKSMEVQKCDDEDEFEIKKFKEMVTSKDNEPKDKLRQPCSIGVEEKNPVSDLCGSNLSRGPRSIFELSSAECNLKFKVRKKNDDKPPENNLLGSDYDD